VSSHVSLLRLVNMEMLATSVIIIIIIFFLTLGRYIPEGFKKLKKVK